MVIRDVIWEVLYGEVHVIAIYEDGSQEFLYAYDPREYTILKGDLVGLSRSEAISLKSDKDRSML